MKLAIIGSGISALTTAQTFLNAGYEIYFFDSNDFNKKNNPNKKLSFFPKVTTSPKYNDINEPLQIHTFGDSWTYGWDIEQERTFTHLLGDENTSVWNHGAGKTGLDYAAKKIAEVYQKYKHYENNNFLYVITVPHAFRRMHFDEQNIGRRSWAKENAIKETEYNHYLYFLHHYELLNSLVGRDKIIWGTWDVEIPHDKMDIFFEIHDFIGPTHHPGPIGHRKYAEKIKNILKKNGWYSEEQV